MFDFALAETPAITHILIGTDTDIFLHMTRHVTTLLFDMDNTLFDLVGAQISACQAVVEELGYDDGNELFSHFLAPVHGFESHENIRQFMTERGLATDGSFTKACQCYEREKLRNIIPYPGVADALQHIREQGLAMGVVTDAHSRDAVLRLEKTGLIRFFAGMVTYDMVQVKKPAPQPFLFALEMMRAGTADSLFIGDSPRRDLEPCRHLGIRTVYARYGDRFSTTREYAGADFVIDSMEDLCPIVRNLSAPVP